VNFPPHRFRKAIICRHGGSCDAVSSCAHSDCARWLHQGRVQRDNEQCERTSVDPLATIATLTVAAITCIEIGLVYATLAKDAKTLYSLVKTLNILILGPLIFYFFPNWPQWIAKLFPTYWFINPMFEIATRGATLADVWIELCVALGFCVAALIPIALLGRRLQRKLAST